MMQRLFHSFYLKLEGGVGAEMGACGSLRFTLCNPDI